MKKVMALLCAIVFLSATTCLSYAAQSVLVTNTATRPIPVTNEDKPVIKPFQVTVNADFSLTDSTAYASFTVPEGKRLVIEYVSGGIALDNGLTSSFGLQTTVDGVLAKHEIAFRDIGPAWGYPRAYQVGQLVRIYADPGTTVKAWAGNQLTGRASFGATISGYLETIK